MKRNIAIIREEKMYSPITGRCLGSIYDKAYDIFNDELPGRWKSYQEINVGWNDRPYVSYEVILRTHIE